MNKDFIFFTTCDPNSQDRIAELMRLMDSVDASFNDNAISYTHVILLQNSTEIPFDKEPYLKIGSRHFLTIDHRVSLSKARNIMIQFALENLFLDGSYLCAFPDDDAWYPAGLLSQIRNYFTINKNQDILITKYGSQPISNPVFEILRPILYLSNLS